MTLTMILFFQSFICGLGFLTGGGLAILLIMAIVFLVEERMRHKRIEKEEKDNV